MEAYEGRAAARIAAGIRTVHRDHGSEGEPIHVAIHKRFVAVLRAVELSEAEHRLVEAGRGEAVRAGRDGFAESLAERCRGVVEEATGQHVEAFASRLTVTGGRPWAADVFLFAEE